MSRSTKRGQVTQGDRVRRRLMTEGPRPDAIRSNPRAPWFVVWTVCMGAFMGQLDASIVTIALPQIGRSLHATVGATEWVALSYLLVLVAMVTAVGHLADRFGRKLLYIYGFAVFTAGSAMCGLAPSLAVLLGARAFQAAGAAMLQANSVALITESMPESLLARGLGVQGTAQALGLALGPAIGGALLAVGGWRLLFLVNVPVGVAGFTLGWLTLPRSRTHLEPGRPDRLGAGLLALAAGGPLVYLSLAQRSGYASKALVLALVCGLAAGAWLVAHERSHAAPLIDFALLRRRALSVGLSSGMISFLVLFGTLLVIPYYLSALHVGTAVAGLRVAVLPLAIAISAPLTGRHVGRVGTRPFTGGGMILSGLGLLEIVAWHTDAGLPIGLALCGLGMGAFTPANNAAIMGAAPTGRTGLVGGMLNMTRGFGTALGVAIAGLLYTAAVGISGAGAAATTVSAAEHGLSVTLASLGATAVAVGALLLIVPPGRPLPLPARRAGQAKSEADVYAASR